MFGLIIPSVPTFRYIDTHYFQRSHRRNMFQKVFYCESCTEETCFPINRI